MKYINDPKTNCSLIEFEYTSDFSPFGARRFSWPFLRGINKEFDINYIYLLRNQGEYDTITFNNNGNMCLLCSNGDYAISADTLDKSELVISEDNRRGVLITGKTQIKATSTFLSGDLLVISEDPVEEFGECALSVNELYDAIFMIESSVEAKIIKLYDYSLFSKNGIMDNLIWVFDDYFKFKNTFRGMYMHIAPRDGIRILTCIKGSVDVYITNVVDEAKESYVIRLDDSAKSLCIDSKYAVGVHSLSDDTLVNQLRREYMDDKYTKRLGLKCCDKALALNKDDLIMSILDRTADETEDIHV